MCWVIVLATIEVCGESLLVERLFFIFLVNRLGFTLA